MSRTSHALAVAVSALLVGGGLVLTSPTSVGAVGNPAIVVTTTADAVTSDAYTSLREAIDAANAASGDDTITLSASTYELSLNCGTDEDGNAGGDLDVDSTDALTINGPSALNRAEITLAVSCTNERLIDLENSGAFAMSNVDLTGGQAPDASGADTDGGNGGAIRSNNASITLTDVDLTNNSAGDAGQATSSATAGGNGGAISSGADVTLSGVLASGNSAGDGYTAAVNSLTSDGGDGGAVYVWGVGATVTLTDSYFDDNVSGTGGTTNGLWSASAGDGGAVFALVKELDVSGTAFATNIAGDGGDSQATNGRDGGRGGAIRVEAQTATVTTSSFNSNQAGKGADSLNSPGIGGLGGAISLAALSGTFTVIISSSTFTNNAAGDSGQSSGTSGTWSNSWGGHGGAIAAVGKDVELYTNHTTFDGNTAGDAGDYVGTGGTVYGGTGGFGGAVALWGSSAYFNSVTFTDNRAGDGGTGSTSSFGGVGGSGGAIGAESFALDNPTVGVEYSTFTGNSTGIGYGLYGQPSGSGGGVHFGVNASGSLAIATSMFTDNHADAGTTNDGNGGAINLLGAAPTLVSNVTMHGNSADGTGGALHSFRSPTTVSLSTLTGNSSGAGWALSASSTTVIVAGSILDDSATTSDGACSTTGISSGGYNVELGSSTCAALSDATDQLGYDAGALLPFADNGGATGFSRLPRAGTDLVDAIPTSDPSCGHGTDQRGVERPVGDGCDIGAVELRDVEPQMFFPVTPVRLVDTRVGQAQGAITVTKKKYGGDDNILRIQVTDIAGVPADGVAAVSLNVTANQTEGIGYLTVYPCGDRPLVSSVNYVTGQTVPNAVIAPVDPDTGDICIYSKENANIIIDIAGYFAESVGFTAVDPTRLVDTRVGQAQGAITVTKKKYGGDDNILRIQVTDIAGVPADGVAAVSLNVTANQTEGIGYLTVYPCGDRPLVSSVNYVTGQTVPNAVIAPVDPDTGDICIYSKENANIIIDIAGYFAESVGFTAVDPTRLVDTRVGQAQGAITVTKKKYGGDDNILRIQVTDIAGVPADGVAAVSLNVTANQTEGIGYLTVYPCGDRPLVSSVNYVTGQTVPNAVIAPVDPDTGDICVYSKENANIIIDIAGWFLTTPAVDPPPPPT